MVSMSGGARALTPNYAQAVAERSFGLQRLVVGRDGEAAERRDELREAAQAGSMPAMYYWGLTCNDPAERARWLSEAARNGGLPAQAELCDD